MKTKDFIKAKWPQIKDHDFEVIDDRTFTTIYLHDVCELMQTYANRECAALTAKLREAEDRIRELEAASLPDGFKTYKCTDCARINVLRDNQEITVGFCIDCGHPLWND